MNRIFLFFKRSSALPLFAFLVSCAPSCPVWRYDAICTSCPYYNSKRIVLPPENPFRGIELVVTKSRSGRRCYINVFSLTLPREENAPQTTKISISCETENIDFYAVRLEGGQRLLLSTEAADYIIGKLLDGRTITISVGRYGGEIIPKGFPEKYRKL